MSDPKWLEFAVPADACDHESDQYHVDECPLCKIERLTAELDLERDAYLLWKVEAEHRKEIHDKFLPEFWNTNAENERLQVRVADLELMLANVLCYPNGIEERKAADRLLAATEQEGEQTTDAQADLKSAADCSK